MKNNLVRSLRRRILLYGLISCISTLIVELFVVFNISIINEYMTETGYGEDPFVYRNATEGMQIFAMVVIGIIVFFVTFLLLMENVVKYLKEITVGISKIADGNLNEKIEVKGDDELSYIAKSLNDMTDRIDILMNKERVAEKTKNELITNVAHDLRTPLTSIIGYMELLSLDKRLDIETRQKYIEVVFMKAKRLEKLIEDLFSFTKLNHGKIAMKVDTVDIVMLVNQLLEDFYPTLSERDLEYEMNSSDPSIFIKADGNLLARLFENLISNAIKYGAHGKIIRVNIRREKENVVVVITNYGYVIPEKELGNIFDKFYRVEQSRSEDTGGTGLGLAIVKNIVGMHKGTVEVRSNLNGTDFEVRLGIDINFDETGFRI